MGKKTIRDEFLTHFQEEFQRNFPADFLMAKLKEEFEAKETKFLQHEGKLIRRNVKAWRIRQLARQDAHRLRGDYPPERREHTGPGGKDLGPITFVMDLSAADEQPRQRKRKRNRIQSKPDSG